MTEEKPYTVHFYYSTRSVEVQHYAMLSEALYVGKKAFKEIVDCYKVKIWDTRMGEIEPNNPNAEALIFEII